VKSYYDRTNSGIRRQIKDDERPKFAQGAASQMKIEVLSVDQLLNDPSNARQHSTKNLDAIKASLLKFGQQKPIVINKEGIVIAGNGTLIAAKELGWSEIKCVRSELGKVEQTAYAIADNRTAELATWDMDILGDTLQSLREDDWDLEDLGFDVGDLGFVDDVDDSPIFNNNIDDKDEDIGKERKFFLEIEFADEDEMKRQYDDLLSQGLVVRVKNG